MEERSTTHSARLDDEMAAETEGLTRGAPVESRAEESLIKEPLSDGEIDRAGEPAYDATAGALDGDERDRRSELAISLRPSVFPAQGHDLVAAAHSESAPSWALDALSDLPTDTRFDNLQEVWDAIGGHRETRGAAEPAPEASVASVPPASAIDADSGGGIVQRGQTAAHTLVGLGVGLVAGVLRVAERGVRRVLSRR